MVLAANMLEDNKTSTVDSQALATHQWMLAERAAKLFALATHQNNGPCPIMIVRAKAGSARDAFLDRLTGLLGDISLTRIGPNIQASTLYDSVDLTSSLASACLSYSKGLLSRTQQGVLLLTVADLAEPEFIRSLCLEIDKNQLLPKAIIALDESDDDVIGIDENLVDRAQFHIDLTWVDHRTTLTNIWSFSHATDLCADIEITDEHLGEIANHCALLGLHSARPAQHVVWLAKRIASSSESRIITLEHIQQSIEITLLPRAKSMPELPLPNEENQQKTQPDQAHNDNYEDPSDAQKKLDEKDIPEDITPEIAESLLTPEMLNALFALGVKQKNFSRKDNEPGRTGSKTIPSERGAPKPSRKGHLHAGGTIDLPATLRNAAPWQKSRKASMQGQPRKNSIVIWPEDIHLKRYTHAPSSVLIFVVDASGSTALNRLSEAKGAMELLLGESYSRRDYIALLAFRKQECEVLLPPTRSLVRAKRELTSLSGGGATPLAKGLMTGMHLAQDQKKAGREPTIVLLTDGSANIALSGAAGRSEAIADAEQMADLVARSGLKSIIIDIGKRRQSKGKDIAERMQGHYVALPFTSAETVSSAVRSAINR